jgi:glycosyltransferase involved in cell wall biosynthesis
MISILMPIYNGIEFIEESVSSILQQTYANWELIIGINGHPENSSIYQIAKAYETKSNKIRVYDFYNIKGKSTALNEMVKYCNYSYVALLDVDDIWHEKKLEIQSPKIGIYDVVGTLCKYFGDKNDVIPTIPTGDISNFNFSHSNPVINSSVIIRKELCYWNSNWDGVEDYDLWLRLKKQNKTFYNCNVIAVKHRIHNTSSFNAKGNDSKVPDLLKQH